jgi:NADPH:quinone reductase-like Zn-dependent oxidoreductase
LCFLGGYATHVLVSASEVIVLQENDDPVKVVALPLNYMTAYGMLTRSVGTLPRGSTILIGSVSGGVGTAVAQIAKTFDMGLVLLGTCSPSKFDYVKSLGVIPIDRFTDDLPARVMELTGGKGVDVAFDAVGTEDSIRANVAATNAGQVVVYGWMNAVAAETGSSTYAALDEFIKSGAVPRTKFWAVTWDYYNTSKDEYLRDLEKIVQAVRDGSLDPVVGKLFRFVNKNAVDNVEEYSLSLAP